MCRHGKPSITSSRSKGHENMCGIVGLLIKKQPLRDQLGALMLPMLIGMTERGPDSAGMAVYGAPTAPGWRKFSLYAADEPYGWTEVEVNARQSLSGDIRLTTIANHAVLQSASAPEAVRSWLKQSFPRLHLLSVGQVIDVYKDVGKPAEIADRYAFAHLSGSHLVGHTRMATESAVTPAHAHPFTAGEDFCLVHNGSLSNPGSVRRDLERRGIRFETDNDTEAACRFLEWRMSEGDTLEEALEKGLVELDG